MSILRHTSRAGLLGLVAMGISCGPGAAAEAIRPKDPTANSALGVEDTAATCTSVSPKAQPFLVDWKDEQRGELEIAMQKGIAVMAYDCKGIRLLPQCHLRGQYGFASMELKKRKIDLTSGDDLSATVPLSAATLHAELKRGSTLQLAYVLVGQKGTTLDAASPSELTGTCDGATHFVSGAWVGAFTFGTATDAAVGGGGKVLGAGADASSSSSKKVENSDGDAASCEKEGLDGKPPKGCGALVKLLLSPFAEKPKEAVDPGKQDEAVAVDSPCGTGFVLTSEGKCAKKTGGVSYLCAPDNVAECTEQCDKGSGESCYNAAVLHTKQTSGDRAANREASFGLYEKGCALDYAPACGRGAHRFLTGAGADLAQGRQMLVKGCDGGDKFSCAIFGILLEKGVLAAKPPNYTEVVKYLGRGCALGNHASCSRLARMYMEGKGVAKNPAEAMKTLSAACDADDLYSCQDVATFYRTGDAGGGGKDAKKAESLFKKVCDKGNMHGCESLGAMYRTGDGVPKATGKAAKYFEMACTAKPASASCGELGDMYEKGEGVSKDVAHALDLYEQSCAKGGFSACSHAGMLYENGPIGVKKDLAKAGLLYEEECKNRDPVNLDATKPACAKAGPLLAKSDKAKAKEHYARVCEWWQDKKDCAELKSLGGAPVGSKKP